MAVRLVHVLLIPLLLYEFAFGDYCRNEDNPSIQFCQSGIISGSKVYINGSSVKTKEDLTDKGCVCYIEQTGNENIILNGAGSCAYCGLQVRVGDVYFRSNDFDRQTYGWGSIVSNDTKFTMTMSLYESTNNLNTAFCITIIANQQVRQVVLNLTCEELVARPYTAISSSPNMITMPPTMVPDTKQNMSSTSTETAMPPKTETTMVLHTTKSIPPTSTENAITPKTETANPTVVIPGNTNGTQGPMANNTNRVTTTTRTGSDPGEPRVDTQTEVIIPAAAGGGAGVLVILVIVVVVCCLRKKRKHAEDPIDMKESERSDAIMTDNVAYGMYIDTHTNPVPQVQAHITGDVYAVVNNDGTSNVRPSVEVPRMQVDETGDVYAIVNKTTKRDIPSIEHSREKSDKSHIQTKGENNNVTVDITPSTDYADISNV